MNIDSLVLRTAARYLLPLMLLLSVFILLRGHNEPGGGFIGGLIAAAAFALYALANSVEAARKLFPIDFHTLVGSGLLLALGAGILPWFSGQPFLTGKWITIESASFGEIELGSPVIFDIGVYLVVIGVALTIIFALAEE